MIGFFRGRETTSDAWVIGRWYEFPGEEAQAGFHDRVSTSAWLRTVEPEDLRRIAHQYIDGTLRSGLSDHQLVEQLVELIVSGALRVWRRDATGKREAKKFEADGPVGNIVRRLRVTAQEFTFEGERLRVIRAEEWVLLRARNDGRYELVPQEAAQARLRKMAEWAAFSIDERGALAEAVAFVPDMRRGQLADGLLLIRIVTRSETTWQKSSEPAVTPSQLAPARATAPVAPATETSTFPGNLDFAAQAATL